ncbi:MAG: radical SAM protein [Bacilli bacterium]|nr:radical SAM protein [Bacilli bacterium]
MKVCWNLTSKCNRNCRFCFREKNLTELSLEDNINVLDNLIKLDVTKITFAGGEPLLYPHLVELMKECKNRGIYNKLNTNGSLLNKDNIHEYLEYVDKIAFSIDSSSDEENYFLGRGSNHYEHITKLIPIIKKEYPNIKIEVNSVITSQTINGIDNLYNSLKDNFKNNEINRWKLIRFCPFRGMSSNISSRFEITDEEFAKISDEFNNKDSSFLINVVNIDEMNEKNIVSQEGILETTKNNQKKYKDLKNINSISKSKYTQIEINNFLNTNLNLYKIFFQVAQYGSLSLASKKMLISQPAISKSIKKLEEELDVVLFYRNINGMSLTDKGKELYKYVEDAYNSIKTGERSMMEANNFYRGKLIVGAPSHIASFYLFNKIKKFHLDYPQIEISIISRSTADLMRMLENHELDFCIDTSPIKENEKILNIEELGEFEHCFASLKEHNYSMSINSIGDLENYPLILPVAHSYHRKKLNDLAFNSDAKFKNVIAIETSEMIKECIMQDLGIGYILKEVIKRELEEGILEEIKLNEKLPSVTINLVYIDKYLTNIPKMFIDNYLK